MNNIDKNKIWLLLSKKLYGDISVYEALELNELLEQNPEAWYTMEAIMAIQELENVPKEFTKEIEDLIKEKINITTPVKEEFNKNNNKDKKYYVISACLSLLILFLFSWVYIYFNENVREKNHKIEIVAVKGTVITHMLPDGTKIKLNAGSKLLYSKNYNTERIRKVELIGEGYFIVAHNPNRPFLVQADVFTIHNLGTEFNVKAYPEDSSTETTLISGSIKVDLNNENKESIVMKPLEKIIYNKHSSNHDSSGKSKYQLISIKIHPNGNDIPEISWIENKIIFKNETLSSISLQLERRFNKKFIFEETIAQNCTLSGNFTDETLEQCLRTLQHICPFKFKVEEDIVVIYR